MRTTSSTKPMNRPTRIMIVDDDLNTLPLYEMIPTIPDTLFTIQLGGLAALKTLDTLNYDIDAVVLDLSMPDRDGLSLTKDIRREENLRGRAQPIQIFWMTGWPVDQDETLKLAKVHYGVKKVFTKPVDPCYVVNKVRESLNGVSAWD